VVASLEEIPLSVPCICLRRHARCRQPRREGWTWQRTWRVLALRCL